MEKEEIEKIRRNIQQLGREQLELFSNRILEMCGKRLKDLNENTFIDVKAKFYPNFRWEIEVGTEKAK